jgi:eukaryotic-like serine/threonine-protein kinase
MSRFGQYELLDRIAVGGMAEVFRGRAFGEEGFEKLVAIKRVLPSYARDSRFVSMLVTEARIHAALSHRNIVQIHDLGISQDGEYFIVLEYVDGPDLSALLTKLTERKTAARLPEAVALYVAVELGEGIHFAHELKGPDGQPLGLVHRDISPSNVLLSYAGEVKLSDFGLAKRRTDHSVVGSLKGKLGYMSPEQARRAPLDRRSDIFALGAVLFELLTGHALRQIADDVSGWQQVASGLVPPTRRFRPDLSPALERLLNRALAPDPRDRFADARAFVDEARAALDALPRSRVGEAGELQAILKSLLPPGAPRPSKEPSRVVRLVSEFGPGMGESGDVTSPGAPARPIIAAAMAGARAGSLSGAIAPVPTPAAGGASGPLSRPTAAGAGPPRRPTPPVVRPPPRPEERRSAAGFIAIDNPAEVAERAERQPGAEARIIAAWPSLGLSATPPLVLDPRASGPMAPPGGAAPLPPPAPPQAAGAPGPSRPRSTPSGMAPLPIRPPPIRFDPGRPFVAPPLPKAAPVPPPGRPSLLGTALVVLVFGTLLMGVAAHFTVMPLNVLAVWWQPARLEIRTEPPGAEVHLDGRRLSASTPTYTEVARDRAPHVLELRRDGHRPERRTVYYDRSVDLTVFITLTPASEASELSTGP